MPVRKKRLSGDVEARERAIWCPGEECSQEGDQRPGLEAGTPEVCREQRRSVCSRRVNKDGAEEMVRDTEVPAEVGQYRDRSYLERD